MKVVIKVGGSLFMEKNGPKTKYLQELIPILKKVDNKNDLIVVSGGGEPVRVYLEKIKPLSLTDEQRENIIINLVHANTILLSELLKKKPVFKTNKITKNCVIGAIKPGRSTDTNAAIAAKKIKADLLIKLTNVNGIYNKDPNKYTDAKKLEKIKFKQIKFADRKTSPGNYGIMDPKAMQIIAKNKIKTIVCNGKDPKILSKIIKGENIGTEIGE